jgi:hypothetical protein
MPAVELNRLGNGGVAVDSLTTPFNKFPSR